MFIVPVKCPVARMAVPGPPTMRIMVPIASAKPIRTLSFMGVPFVGRTYTLVVPAVPHRSLSPG